MPVINVKKDGKWEDIASTYNHAHTMSDITDLPADTADILKELQRKVGAEDMTIAERISTAVTLSQYEHPPHHFVDEIQGLADVAISGDYNDLINTPDPYVHPEKHSANEIEGLATVATSGSYQDLTNKPVIPSIVGLATKTYVDEQIASVGGGGITEQVQSDWDETDTTSPAYIKNKPVISGDGGASVQVNWNQNDETAADFIKNKPFGECEGEVDVLPLKRYTDFILDPQFGYSKSDMGLDLQLTIGESYTVYWDGVEYKDCVAQDASFIMTGAVALGNLSVLNPNLSGNNEPFVIGCSGLGTVYMAIMDTEVGNSHDIRITKTGTVVNYLDNKYLSFMDYVEPKAVDILPLTEYTGFTLDPSFGYSKQDASVFNLVVGETYTVYWDEVEYKNCVAQDASAISGMSGTAAIGNLSAFDQSLSGNNEPFIIASVSGIAVSYLAITDTEEGRSHKIKISQDASGYHVIKDEYAPQSDWNNMKNKPFETIPAGTVAIEETTVDCSFQWSSTLYGMAIQRFDMYEALYNVEFDGKSYLITSYKYSGYNEFELQYEDDEIKFRIMADYDNNLFVLLCSVQGEHTVKLTLAEDFIKKIDSKYTSVPEVTTYDNSKVMTVVDGKWMAKTPASGLPSVTTSDVGKFLRVNSSGAWVAEAIPNAEGASF